MGSKVKVAKFVQEQILNYDCWLCYEYYCLHHDFFHKFVKHVMKSLSYKHLVTGYTKKNMNWGFYICFEVHKNLKYAYMVKIHIRNVFE